MSTLCSCSPMRNTLQRRLSSRSSSAENSCTDSTPFWSSSVLLGLGRSSERRTSGQSLRPGHPQLPRDELGYNLTRPLKHLYGPFYRFPLMRFNRLASIAHLLLFHLDFMHSVGINTSNHSATFPNFCLQNISQWMDANMVTMSCWQQWWVTLKRRSFISNMQKCRRNENCDVNQRIRFHLWLAPVFSLFPKHQKHRFTPKQLLITVDLNKKKNHIFLYRIASYTVTFSMMLNNAALCLQDKESSKISIHNVLWFVFLIKSLPIAFRNTEWRMAGN